MRHTEVGVPPTAHHTALCLSPMSKAPRLVVDSLLALLLPVLVSFVLTGRLVHEWLALGMMTVLALHHVINSYWVKKLCRGRYDATRTIGTVVNVLMLLDVLVLSATGALLSKYALGWLGLKPYRPPYCHAIHIAAAYWGLILMGLHIGLHTPWIVGVLRLRKRPRLRLACRFLCLVIAAYGVYAFVGQRVGDYLTAASHFVNCETSPLLFMLETCTMVVLFAVFGNALRLKR